MWTDNRLQVINEDDQYVGADGTTYPANFPKAEIPGLFPVTLTQRPDDALNSVHGFSIDENHAQVWIYAPRTVEQMAAMKREAQSDRWEAIKAERDRRKAGGVKVGQFWFHSDEGSRTQYAILDSKAMRSGWPDSAVIHPNWKTMAKDQSGASIYTPMTVALLRQILDAGIVQEAALFDKAEAHRAGMEASTNPAEYDFSAGWPKIYGE